MLRVLIVEHDMLDVELCVRELERAGYDVHAEVAKTRDEFTARIGSGTYDIVLADYRLPGWTGLDALAVLREHHVNIPLIMVTGTLGEERAVESLKQGVADYVLKANIARLPFAVRRALEEKAARAERARAEETIRKLTLAVDQSPAVIFITDTHGTIEYANARFTEVTGYALGEAIGRTPRLLQSGNTPVATYHALWSRLRAGGVWQGEIQNRRKDGSLYWDAVTISPLRDSSGSVSHFLAVQEDMTDRMRIERDLREREARFRQLADNISEVFFIVDAEFRETLYINPAYEKLWGRSRDSLYADPLSFLEPIEPADQERLLASMARVRAGEDPGSIEFHIRRPDGERRLMLSHAVPIRNEQGEVYRISGFVLDVTERKRAQDALIANELRLQKLFETVNLIVLVLDASGRIEYLNPFALKLLGYSTAEAIGQAWFDLAIPPADRDRMHGVFRELVEEDLQAHYQNTIVTRSGAARTIAWHNTVLRDEQGKARGTLSVGEDVTQHELLEKQYRHSQRMEAIGQLAGGIAHDFNNLLTVILTSAELMRDGLSPDDPRLEDIDTISHATEGAAALTRQLLAFSRQQVVDPHLVRLEDEVINSQKLLSRVIGEDVVLRTVLSPTPCSTLIDPGHLDQIIMNIAVNARDAMPQGGVLTIETRIVDLDAESALEHFPAVPGRYAVLAMSDTGAGMDEETRSRIFEPFFTTKEVGKGTGLGLATVYGIVSQAGGFIAVESAPGAGSTFRIHLPFADGTLYPTPAPASAAAATSGGSETILLVEDAEAVRTVTRDVLERFGYRVLTAARGREALDLLERHTGPIDLLLTDVVMPEMSGRELSVHFRRLRPGAKVLFMSGYADDAIVRHGVIEPGMVYLQKPFTIDGLAHKVRQALDSAMT